MYAFPCVFFVLACPHVHMFAPACKFGVPACVPCVCVRACMCVYVFQESQWLDSVSLLIKDTLEGEMLMIDNLSGSVFHHYSSPPPICKDCKGHPQEVPPWMHVNMQINVVQIPTFREQMLHAVGDKFKEINRHNIS